MGRRFSWWSLGLCALACSGCFEADTKISLASDGSGVQTMRLGLGGRALDTLRGAALAVAASARRSDPVDIFDAKKVEAELAEQGLRLTSHRVATEGERQRVELAASFADLTVLRRNPLAGGTRATWQVRRGAQRDQVALRWFPQGEDAWRAAREQARELAQAPDATLQHFLTTRLQQVEGLDVSIALQLPGDVVAHTANLTLSGKREVRARILATDLHTAYDLLVRLAPRYEVVFTCPGFPVDDDQEEPAKAHAAPGVDVPSPRR